MSTYTLPVILRNEKGSNAMRKLRQNGMVPSVLYGHNQENINLSVNKADLNDALKAKARMVSLQWEGKSENAFVKDLQYDLLGDEIIHMDFTRVDLGEKVKLAIPVELYGEPVGQKKHGVLDHILKEINIECVVTSIPEGIRVNVSELDLGQSISVKDLDFPENVSVEDNPDAVVASVHLIAAEKEETEEELAEPEVIAAKKEGEEEEEQ